MPVVGHHGLRDPGAVSASSEHGGPGKLRADSPFTQSVPGQHMAARWHLLRGPRQAAQNGFSSRGFRQNFLVLQSLSDTHCEPCEGTFVHRARESSEM